MINFGDGQEWHNIYFYAEIKTRFISVPSKLIVKFYSLQIINSC